MVQPETRAPSEKYEAAKLRWASLADAQLLAGLYGERAEGVLAWLERGGGLILESAEGELLAALRWREEGEGWRVDPVATRPEARGQGYGRWLMTKLEALAIRANIPTLTLRLEHPDDEVLRYYRRMGYLSAEPGDCELHKRVGGTWQVKR